MKTIDEEKIKATDLYKCERELCKNPDMSQYQTTHAEIMGFMNGGDSAVKFLSSIERMESK